MAGEKKRIEVLWPLLCGLFFVLFLLSLSLHLWDLKPWGSKIDYRKAGPWADLITGLGTLFTAFVAFGGIYLENRRARAAEEALERKFNTQIYSWLEPRLIEGKREWLLCFENNVGVPIYEWMITLVGLDKELSSSQLGPIRPKSSEMILDELRGMEHAAIPKVRFSFTDPTGTVWTRTEGGLLQKGKVELSLSGAIEMLRAGIGDSANEELSKGK